MTPDRQSHSPLLGAIIEKRGYRVVAADELDAVCGDLELAMLFLAGDHWRLAESDDVAVVLPELDRAFKGLVTPLIAARGEDERALQRRFRFSSYPALVFLRLGEYLGVVEGIRDWSEYLREIPEILTREPSPPPPFKMPAGCGSEPLTRGAQA